MNCFGCIATGRIYRVFYSTLLALNQIQHRAIFPEQSIRILVNFKSFLSRKTVMLHMSDYFDSQLCYTSNHQEIKINVYVVTYNLNLFTLHTKLKLIFIHLKNLSKLFFTSYKNEINENLRKMIMHFQQCDKIFPMNLTLE